ncbi:MAG: alpha/beta fold hydrolase [Anaerolineae bacterium]
MKLLKTLTYLAGLLLAAALATRKAVLARLFLWPFKLTGGALAPILGIVSGLGSVLGLARRDWKWAGTGAAGMALAAQLLQDLPDSEAKFDAAFGPEWQRRIPASLQPRMPSRRWSLVAREPGPAIWQRDVAYGKNPKTGTILLADLWGPSAGVAPTGLSVVYVHGGGWRVGFKDMGTRPFFRRLASQGHVILDIEYTLAPEGDIPSMIAEIKEAVLWIKAHSDEYGLDAQRVVLMGGSAGAHLALLAAYTADHPSLPPLSGEGDVSVRGVVAYYPPVDFLSLHQPGAEELPRPGDGTWSPELDRVSQAILAKMFVLPRDESGKQLEFRDMLSDMIGGTPDEFPEVYKLLSPICHVGPHCPPTLLLQGTDDIFDLMPGVRRIHEELQGAGATSILVEFPHAEHAFDLVLPRVSPAAQVATYDVERFLALLV